ncbi:hypothetical protein RJD24_08105 [Bacillaceae bacterium IKA-2]|nr:hypothetical protein RJD24_08105 [Bacillaceae bacterium IKA-2]
MKRTENDYFDEEIKDFLDNFTFEYPDESEIESTINSLRKYVPKKRRKIDSLVANSKELLFHSTRELFNLSSLFWSLNLLFFISGLIYVFFFNGNPYSTVISLSPIPIFLGLVEAFKSRESSSFEIELSCKYSPQQIILSRLFIVSTFNFVLNIVLVVSLSSLIDNILPLKLLLYWMVPNIVVAALGLFLTLRFRSYVIIPVLSVLWVVILTSSTITEFLYQKVESFSPYSYVSVSVLFLYILFVQIKKLKRGDFLEFTG